MRADGVLRTAMIALVSSLLFACQAPDGARPAGPVAFVDVSGHRVVIDDSKLPPEPVVARAAAATPSVVASSAAPSPATAGILDEAEYVPAEEFERQMDEKAGDRFYLVPDGKGGLGPVTAKTLEAGEPAPAAPVVGELPEHQEPLLACPPGGARLEHLLLLDDKARALTLDFPVHDPTLKTRQRFAGYRLKIPSGATGVRLTGILRNGASPDVAVLQAIDAVPLAVVNNYATESIPETPFRYAMVKGAMPVLMGSGGARELVVIEGGWARQVLDTMCRPERGAHTATGGRVVVEFVGNSKEDSKGGQR